MFIFNQIICNTNPKHGNRMLLHKQTHAAIQDCHTEFFGKQRSITLDDINRSYKTMLYYTHLLFMLKSI